MDANDKAAKQAAGAADESESQRPLALPRWALSLADVRRVG